MKKITILTMLLLSAGCGTIITKSNQTINIENKSGIDLIATTEDRKLNIPARTSASITSYKNILINANGCDDYTIERVPNYGAFTLDAVSWIILGVIPFFVDAITGNLYELPENYTYSCK